MSLATVPAPSAAARAAAGARARAALRALDAVLVAHYYVDGDLQDLADETGGCVADSLEMARFGRDHPARTLVVAGVRFMGETAKILSPDKRVLMPTLDATCSLDLGCPVDDFAAFCDAHPDRTVVVYANTSAAVKARADWVTTSSTGLDIVRHLHEQGRRRSSGRPTATWARYIQRRPARTCCCGTAPASSTTSSRASSWTCCARSIPARRSWCTPSRPRRSSRWPTWSARPPSCCGRPSRARREEFIVATDNGILHKMRQAAPGQGLHRGADRRQQRDLQELRALPVDGDESLDQLAATLEAAHAGSAAQEIRVDPDLGLRARRPIDRMLDFAAARKAAPAPFSSQGSQGLGPA